MSERKVDFLASDENTISSLVRMDSIIVAVTNVSGGSFRRDWSAYMISRRALSVLPLSKMQLDPCLAFGMVVVLSELVWRCGDVA